MDNFKAVYKILRALEAAAAMDYPEFEISQAGPEALGVSRERWNRYIEMMADVGYIKGVTVQYDILGALQVRASQIRITLKGLEYLQENSIMQKLYHAAKGPKGTQENATPAKQRSIRSERKPMVTTYTCPHIGELLGLTVTNDRETVKRYIERGYTLFTVPQMFGEETGPIVLYQEREAKGVEDADAVLKAYEQGARSHISGADG